MDITIYLPDDIGKWAKEAQLNLSALLRNAVIEEKSNREHLDLLAGRAQIVLLEVEEDEGAYTARFTGTRITENVYVTDDERVLLYDDRRLQIHQIEDPQDELRDALTMPDYVEAMVALGLRPIVDV